MATEVLYNAFVSINGVDLSDHVVSVDLSYEAEMKDDTTMGDTTRSQVGSLLNWGLNITFKQDYAASKVDATLFPLVGLAANSVPIILRKSTAAVGTTNPQFAAYGAVQNYKPLGGAVGDSHEAPVSIVPSKKSGSHILARTTA